MKEILNEVEIRILGCLIEKEKTTPDYYPPSLNALKNACNQKSNRNPVVFYENETVLQGIKSLQSKRLVLIASGAGLRVRKYVHKFKDKYNLSVQEMVVLCELMLRGSQTLGEIRNHAGRMFPINSLEEVNDILNELKNERDIPLITEIPRQPGQKESRYMHLLSGEVEIPKIENVPVKDSVIKGTDPRDQKIKKLEEDLESLKILLLQLKEEFEKFKKQFE